MRAAEVTDHIIPHRGGIDLFWNRDNWQSLCKRCHDRKTAMEDGGFGRRLKSLGGGSDLDSARVDHVASLLRAPAV